MTLTLIMVIVLRQCTPYLRGSHETARSWEVRGLTVGPRTVESLVVWRPDSGTNDGTPIVTLFRSRKRLRRKRDSWRTLVSPVFSQPFSPDAVSVLHTQVQEVHVAFHNLTGGTFRRRESRGNSGLVFPNLNLWTFFPRTTRTLGKTPSPKTVSGLTKGVSRYPKESF